MLLAALIDAGCPLDVVRDAAHACGVDELTVDVEEVSRAGLRALRLRIDDDATQRVERDLSSAVAAVQTSGLPERARLRAIATLRRLGSVEAHLHGGDPEHVHLHELSAADT